MTCNVTSTWRLPALPGRVLCTVDTCSHVAGNLWRRIPGPQPILAWASPMPFHSPLPCLSTGKNNRAMNFYEALTGTKAWREK